MWKSTTTYQKSDLVIHLGSTFRALRTNRNKVPGVSTSAGDWRIFAVKGAQGPAGPSAVPNGSASAPAFRFTSSTNTGIFSPSAGKIAMVAGGSLFLHDIGSDNLGLGKSALNSATSGVGNVALGLLALNANTTGSRNVAVGRTVLLNNTTGSNNTAVGDLAMQGNTTGSRNTALGYRTLFQNEVENDNTAVGFQALRSNTSGFGNTAIGVDALLNNDGVFNIAVGLEALLANVSGDRNIAVGEWALDSNLSGSENVAVGDNTLTQVTTGDSNVAIGTSAGFFATNPEDSIFIGNGGASGDTLTIKIGTEGTQTSTFIAGIAGTDIGAGGTSVFINTDGQLGTVLSSRRYKEDIQSMGAMSDMLARLRPVTFRYIKPYDDGSKPLQYGLIAEEVAEVFPDLAVFNEHGQPETVKHHLLPTFLLEGFQEQRKIIAAQAELIASLEARLGRIEALLQPPAVTMASTGR